MTSVGKAPDCFKKEHYSAFLMSVRQDTFFSCVGQFVRRKHQIRIENIVFCTLRDGRALLLVDVHFYKHVFSILLRQKNVSVASGQLAGQIFNCTRIKQ